MAIFEPWTILLIIALCWGSFLLGGAIGFTLAAMLTVSKRADEAMEKMQETEKLL